MHNIAYARWSWRGLIATCPTTKMEYLPLRYTFTSVGNRHAVWCDCRLCDKFCHTRGEAAFDPSQPQPHLYLIDQVRYAGD